ncbi:tagaturonate reductase [Klebsiella pneumoniae]|nr:tagaturonate reductase [Klebsiella pneumoniae]
MKSIQDQVLDLFKDEISTRLDKNWKEIPLELDYDLFDAPGDDLHDALNKFEQNLMLIFPVLNGRVISLGRVLQC